ncbi:glycosyltransferase [Pseudomonadota bacterium]
MAGSFCLGYLGADWWGSDARAMAMEFRRQGHMLIERNYEDYLSTKWQSINLKIVRRLTLPSIKKEYNSSVEELLAVQALDFLLVFKGMLLEADTLKKFIDRGLPCYLVYPDVSFKDHGSNIWQSLPLYDCVFTTKSFHLDDENIRDKVKNLHLVNHGYDPEVHRPLAQNNTLLSTYGCDVSFVGCWSPKKENLIKSIVEGLPSVEIALWGPNWDRADSRVAEKWRGRGAYGDELAAIYSCSKINLGLLSEAGSEGQVGDQTTARSWQIPASGGMLLHEDNAEIRKYYETDKEIGIFDSKEELTNKISLLLENTSIRDSIRVAGHDRCVSAPYTYSAAVNAVVNYHINQVDD